MRRFLVTLLLATVVAGCSRDAAEAPDEPAAVAPAVRMAPAVPEARTEVGSARLGDRIIVLGGLRADGTATGRVDVYDLETESWSEGPALPKALHHPGVTTFQGRVVVAGGYVTAGGAWLETDDVWSLGDDLDAGWREEPRLHTARGALGLAATGDRLLAFGGTVAGQVLTSVELFVTGADAWRTFPPLRQPREHLAATGAGGRIYAIGGRVGGLETNLASVESIDPNAFAPEWRDEPDLTKARGGIAAATVDRRPCVAGGEEPTGTIATVECLDGGRWRLAATMSEPRHGLGVVAGDDGRLHVLAGGPQPGLFVSTAHEVLAL